MLLTGAFAQQSRQLLHEGNQAYKEGNYEQAESLYRSAVEKDKGDFIGNFNLGTALYRQGRYEEAVEQFIASYPLQEDPKLVAKACHNVGNSWLQQRKWKEAADAYKEALKNNPNDEKSRYNLAYAQAMMKKDPPQQQDQDKQNEENKDKKEGQREKKDQNQGQGDDQEDKKDKEQQEQQSQGSENQNKQKQQQQHQLSKAEAKRLLDASNNAERKTQAKVMVGKKQKKEKTKIEKDW